MAEAVLGWRHYDHGTIDREIKGVGIKDVSIGVSDRTAPEAICRAALGVAEFLSSSQGNNSGSEVEHEEAGHEGAEGKLP